MDKKAEKKADTIQVGWHVGDQTRQNRDSIQTTQSISSEDEFLVSVTESSGSSEDSDKDDSVKSGSGDSH